MEIAEDCFGCRNKLSVYYSTSFSEKERKSGRKEKIYKYTFHALVRKEPAPLRSGLFGGIYLKKRGSIRDRMGENQV